MDIFGFILFSQLPNQLALIELHCLITNIFIMIVTVEMSLYPLQVEYKSTILTFIATLRAHSSISTYTTEMSTYIKGEWGDVMSILEKELGEVYKVIPASSTILKIIPQDLPVENGFRSF